MMETMRPMPTLKGQDAKDFLKRIEEGLKKPLTLRPVPNIEQAKKLARERHLHK